jgi:chemotaxis protein CheX
MAMAMTIDVKLLNPFLEATVDCLTQMAGVRPHRKRVFVKTDPTMHGQVTGVIGISNGMTGSCAVSFPAVLANRLVGSFLGESPAKITAAMMCDGVGEIANMVAGAAKRQFVTQGIHFDISTPTVVMGGEKTAVHNPNGTMNIACEFTAFPDLEETFLLEIALKPTERGQ